MDRKSLQPNRSLRQWQTRRKTGTQSYGPNPTQWARPPSRRRQRSGRSLQPSLAGDEGFCLPPPVRRRDHVTGTSASQSLRSQSCQTTPDRPLACVLSDEVAGVTRPQPLTLTLTRVTPAGASHPRSPRDIVRAIDAAMPQTVAALRCLCGVTGRAGDLQSLTRLPLAAVPRLDPTHTTPTQARTERRHAAAMTTTDLTLVVTTGTPSVHPGAIGGSRSRLFACLQHRPRYASSDGRPHRARQPR